MENKGRKNKLSKEIKQKICSAVEKNIIIWKKTERNHSNRNAMKQAWELVSNEVGVSEKLCRIGWKSIMDSRRYRKKKSASSGSSCNLSLDMNLDCESSNESWDLTQSLDFLEDTSNQRSTFSTVVLETTTESEPLQNTQSSYSYDTSTSTSASSARMQYMKDMTENSYHIKESMDRMAGLAEQEQSPHAGFLHHIESIMDTFSSRELLIFKRRVSDIAYDMQQEQLENN
ncbi:uncharacterized protein LOC142239427 [Haematobia irritans]|uniref:uncharacterized protein LOC142223580 n=1 Tax=Haematobia irritans TaxID=7368 RepID=UPI003F50D1A8